MAVEGSNTIDFIAHDPEADVVFIDLVQREHLSPLGIELSWKLYDPTAEASDETRD